MKEKGNYAKRGEISGREGKSKKGKRGEISERELISEREGK